jgi:hypothetical protein
MKVQPTYYRGISFVHIPDLPLEQQQALKSSPKVPERIKIMMHGKIIDECLQYARYSEWYLGVYKVAQAEGTYAVNAPVLKPAQVLVPKAS